MTRRYSTIPLRTVSLIVCVTAAGASAEASGSTAYRQLRGPSSAIVVGQGIGGVTVGMTTATLFRLFGKPAHAEMYGSRPAGGDLTYRLRAGEVTVTVSGGRVDGVSTASSRFSTPDRAVHVGARPSGRRWHGFSVDSCGSGFVHYYIRTDRGIDTLLWIGKFGRIGGINISGPGPWCDAGGQ